MITNNFIVVIVPWLIDFFWLHEVFVVTEYLTTSSEHIARNFVDDLRDRQLTRLSEAVD